MHRLAAVPGLPEDPGADGQIPYVEQPAAPVLLLSSADTDLVACADLLARRPDLLGVEARALNLAALSHPAVIDHYLASTVRHARLVLVRLLGGRGHWSYGLEQLQAWARQPAADGTPRQLLVLSGTSELDRELAALGTIPAPLALALAECLRVGGPDNLAALLRTLALLLSGEEPEPPAVVPAADPLEHDWRDEPGARVGVILYRALAQAGDTELMEAMLEALRRRGLCPRGLWVSSLRDAAVQRGVGDLLERERVEAVLCGTGFASVSFEEAGLGAPLWDRLAVPVLQLLTSGRPRQEWQRSAIGLGPLDLSLQVALPELDGRIGTRVGAFKEVVLSGTGSTDTPLEHLGTPAARPDSLGDGSEGTGVGSGGPADRTAAASEPTAQANGLPGLATALQRLRPDRERLAWIASLTDAWIQLRRTPSERRRVALVLANYPTRNSRLANGVGLDTPASTAAMLQWLQRAGYDLGDGPLPADGEALIARLLAGRSNDPESGHRPALAHLSLESYLGWYGSLPEEGRRRLEAVWGPPERDAGLEAAPASVPGDAGEPGTALDRGEALQRGRSPERAGMAGAGSAHPSSRVGRGFAVRGLRFGNVTVLIQPERGYDRDPSLSYHSPDLPPTHAYLAQYRWLRESFGAQVVVHVGKHGNLEWLPGKGVGLSAGCFPEWALGPLPHLYPFIVNDPGEGSQAKRRAQAVILDHLTPPLGRAGLHGELQALESLLDEYWEARSLGGERATGLRQRLASRLQQLELPGGAGEEDLDVRLDAADGYLCELKEAQIRLGLHRYGSLPQAGALAELLLCLARPPQEGLCGLTQALARDLGLELDPWADPEEAPLAEVDRQRLVALLPAPPQPTPPLRHCGDATERLESWALALVEAELQLAGALPRNDADQNRPAPGGDLPPLGPLAEEVLAHLRSRLLPSLLACGEAERQAFLTGLEGGRIAAGPSGAPTRGRPDLLPTGRNFYSVDLRGLPTEAAWDLGRRSAELLLDLHRLEQGEELRTLALSVWGTATMRNGGEDIAQALALMGVRPVWDGPTRRMVDLEVIPLSLLGRPRVDVTLRISGLFRDAFPQLVGWMNRATRLVAALPGEGEANPLAQAAQAEGHWGRVFGSAPGAYGAGLQGLIDSGQWESRADLASAFLNWSQWRYDGEMLAGGSSLVAGGVAGSAAAGEGVRDSAAPATAPMSTTTPTSATAPMSATTPTSAPATERMSAPATAPTSAPMSAMATAPNAGAEITTGLQVQPDRQGLEQRLAQVQVVLHNQDNREHDLLDSDDYYQFHGGLSAAVETLSGDRPQVWFGDHSRSARPRLHRLEKEFDKVLRSRLLNPRWIEAMMQHGYKGGFEMAASLDYLFAYDASSGRVPDWSYGAISTTWLNDAQVLAFLRRHNPWALRDMAERLLEAQQRGLWEGAEDQEIERLRSLVLESEGWIEAS